MAEKDIQHLVILFCYTTKKITTAIFKLFCTHSLLMDYVPYPLDVIAVKGGCPQTSLSLTQHSQTLSKLPNMIQLPIMCAADLYTLQ